MDILKSDKISSEFAVSWLCILSGAISSEQATLRIIALFLFALLYLSFVYAVNDFFDRDDDRLVGKPNTIGDLSIYTGVIWLVALVVIGVATLAPFYQQKWVIGSVVLSYISAATYSMPPLRFKERKLAGLLVAASHRALPVLVGMLVFEDFQVSSWLLFVICLLVGVRWNIVHQLIDFSKDEQTQTSTFVRAYGYARSLRLLKIVVFPIELVLILVWWGTVSLQQPMMLLLVPAYIIWLMILWRNGPMLNWTIAILNGSCKNPIFIKFGKVEYLSLSKKIK